MVADAEVRWMCLSEESGVSSIPRARRIASLQKIE
jgi:hypothetical protein